jgi:mannan endo-1,4-beta-mannosidase
MKLSHILPFLAASYAAAASIAPAVGSIENTARAVTANPSVNGLLFNIDGVSKYWAGTNSYWIGFLTNNSDVDLVMSHLATAGLKILRVWGFNDVNTVPGTGTVYYQALVPGQPAVINTGANGLQRLDVVVASAEKHGIKLIINFVSYSSYTNVTSSREAHWKNGRLVIRYCRDSIE